MSTKIIYLVLIIYQSFSCSFCANFRYAEQEVDRLDTNLELIPRPTKFAKIEREFRIPKKNITKHEKTKKKPDDELSFDIFDKKHYIKINLPPENKPNLPDLQQESSNITETSTPVETTLEKYRNFPPSPDFVTSRNFQKPMKENSKSLKESEEGFFTKINTVIRNQFTKIFNPYKDLNGSSSDSSRNFGSKSSFDKYFTRFGTVERVQDKPVKNKRFLNIFTILQFENSRCQAQGSFLSYEGTCYHRSECAALGGYSMGACAKGYGVCCVFRGTCGTVSNQNTTYFECDNCTGVTPAMTTTVIPPVTPVGPPIDPRFNLSALIEQFNTHGKQIPVPIPLPIPLPIPGVTNISPCVFTVVKKSPDVKQLRIDFLDLDLRGPTNGTCREDQLIVTGQNTNNIIPVICGYNTGQHMYVDVSNVPGPIKITVMLMSTQSKRFRIRVSQLRAPCANFMNCLQYYTGVEGTISSFNYDASPTGLSTPQYFNNLNYAICIRKEPGYCTVTYTNVQNGVEAPFDIRNVDIRGVSLVPPNQAGVEIFNCPDDYISVNGVRFCGGKLNDGTRTFDLTMNAPVTDQSAGPIVLPFRTNSSVVGRGFKLYYRQNLCTI